jgi:hypothetical protein
MNVIPEKSLEHYIVYIHFTRYNTEQNKEGTSSFYHSEYKVLINYIIKELSIWTK